jgi:hypothetical protein
MALVVNDRVQQTGTANTTVSFTLTGTVLGYQSFAVIGNGNTTFYAATDVSGNWEVGVGTYATSGPTLTRTTILSSSNSGSAVTFSGTVNVFVTYPSEQSVNLNASGNVSPLGTITSGVWNGTTIPVAYGGTGVTSSSGANSVVLRDANQNISFNNFIAGATITTAAAGTTVLTVASTRNQILVGSTTQTIQLPNATTLQLGQSFIFVNNSSGILTITNNAGATLDTVPSGGTAQLGATSIATSAGSWGIYSFLPGTYNFNNATADFGGASIIDAVWNGTTIGTAYGGTGLTTFTATNNALYSTGASTLTAGTLPVAAGGTGATTLTSNGVVYGNGTSAAGITAAGTTGQVLVATTSGAPSWGSVPAGSITGVVPIVNGGTGQTTAAAAFNALSPLTTTGDIIYEASASTAARLPVGSTGQVLTVSGGIPSWSTPSTGGGTITRTDFTATAGQTVFSVTYTVGLIDVYQNGAKLAQADFTATNGTSFTLATGAAAGDLIQAEVFSSLNIYSTITSETFNGTGSQTVFTMSSVPANTASLLVAISGVVQDPTTYTVSSNTLTFSTAPPSASGNISVRYLGIASVGTVGSFSAGTTGLTPASATTGAVVLAGTLNVANGGTGLNSFTANQIHYGTFSQSANLTFNGTTLTTTNDASISGLTVGKGGGAGANNTALGYQALNGNISGVGLFVAGYQAGLVTTGSYSTFTGFQAGKANTSGENTAYGANALLQNTTGTANTALGGTTTSISGALASNTTGGSNVGVGVGALASNTTASENTAVGYQASYSNTTGTQNVSVGKESLKATTTGSFNTSFGYQSLLANTTANSSTAIGYQALSANTTGAANTAVGIFAGSGITTGTKNSIFGSYNGNQGGLDIRTASNYIVLSDGDGNPWVVVNSGGSMVLGGNGYSYDASPYQATEGFIVGLNDGTRYGAIFGCNNIANREAVVFVNPNGAVGNIRTNGSSTAFNTSSDYRLKENIAPMTGALAKVAQLKPVTYKWKIDNTDGEGFIAHELAEVCPYAVSGEKDAVDKNGKIKPQGIDVSFLVATLTAAIQELKAEVDSLKQQLGK